MHSSEYGDREVKDHTIFQHNGDYSGEVTILRNSEKSEVTIHHHDHLASMVVPYEHLEKLVLDKLRKDAISQLEDANYDQLRNIFFGIV